MVGYESNARLFYLLFNGEEESFMKIKQNINFFRILISIVIVGFLSFTGSTVILAQVAKTNQDSEFISIKEEISSITKEIRLFLMGKLSFKKIKKFFKDRDCLSKLKEYENKVKNIGDILAKNGIAFFDIKIKVESIRPLLGKKVLIRGKLIEFMDHIKGKRFKREKVFTIPVKLTDEEYIFEKLFPFPDFESLKEVKELKVKKGKKIINAYIDKKLTPIVGKIIVSEGYYASNFRIHFLSPGIRYDGVIPKESGFTITSLQSGKQVYRFTCPTSKANFKRPRRIRLKLRQGLYILTVDGSKNANVELTYELKRKRK